MKQYLFCLFATIMATGIAAFTTHGKSKRTNRTSVFFEYRLASYTEAEVRSPENWKEVPDLITGCSGSTDHKACRIEVDESTTVGTAPRRKLKPVTVIPVAQFKPGQYYVDQLGVGDVISAVNKE